MEILPNSNLDHLKNEIQKAFKKVNKEEIRKAVSSFNKRVRAVELANGEYCHK